MGTNISFKMDVTWSCHHRTGHCEVSKYILRTCMSGCCALNEKNRAGKTEQIGGSGCLWDDSKSSCRWEDKGNERQQEIKKKELREEV